MSSQASTSREHWPMDSEATEIWSLAAWIGKLSSDDYLRSFTSLLIALLRAQNDLSKWLNRYCVVRGIDVAGIYQARQFSGKTWNEIQRLRQGRAEPENSQVKSLPNQVTEREADGKPPVTSSARQLMDEAMALAQKTKAGEIGVRHLIGAYCIGIQRNPTLQRDHLEQIMEWGSEPARESSALLRQIRSRYPEELDHWIKFHYEAFGSEPDLKSADPLPESRLSGFSPDAAKGKHILQQDYLDIEDDVHAMASLICSRKVTPPLSIGLFGEWGSGKTFFMNKLREAVEWISGQARNSGEPQKEITFYKNIVQVDFNAWNYSGGNLWACLVQHILENLRVTEGEDGGLLEARRKQIQEQMNLQQAALNAAEQDKSRAQEALQSAQDTLDSLKKNHTKELEDLKKVLAKDVWETTEIPADVQAQLNEIRKQTGLEEVAGKAATLLAAINETRALLARGSSALTVGTGATRIRFIAGSIAVLVIPVLAAIYVPKLVANSEVALQPIAAASAWVSTLLGGAATWISRKNAFLAKKIAKVEELNARVQQRVEAEKSRQAAEAAEIEKRITLFQAEITSANDRKETAQRQMTEAQVALDHTTAASVLADLIEKRSDSQDYRRHLGLLAVVRKDFEAIAGLIDAENKALIENPEKENINSDSRINRIVLYIDDLDRCPEHKVVEVLQAVHLLLALPLFVVVVGVDSRWLSRSLTKRFPNLLAASTESNTASPTDYLEKIFQIPFWVKRMDDHAVHRMVTGILGENVVKTTPAPEPAPGPVVVEPVEPSVFQRKAYEANPKSMDIVPEEIDFIQKLSPLLGRSPRALKRFANIYRIIKAALPADDQTSFFLGETAFGPPYQTVLFLLAVATGFPAEAGTIFTALRNSMPIPDALPSPLVKWMDESWHDWRTAPTESIAPWGACVARYSFRSENVA